MTQPAITTRLGLACAALLALSACAAPRQDQSEVSPQKAAACRAQAEEIYLKQNRAEVYRADVYSANLRDTPYSSNLLDGVPTRGLSSSYARQQMYDDCLRAAGRPGTAPPAKGPTNPQPGVPQ